MLENKLRPEEAETFQRAYTKYLGWLAVMSKPGSDFAIGLHGREEYKEELEQIAFMAVTGMVEHLRTIVQLACTFRAADKRNVSNEYAKVLIQMKASIPSCHGDCYAVDRLPAEGVGDE